MNARRESPNTSSFRYTAWTTDGLKHGLLDRSDALEVSEWLESQGWVPVEVQAWRPAKRVETTARCRPIRGADLARLARRLEVLLGAGVPLASALAVASRQSADANLARALDDVRDSVEQGSLLSESLEMRPELFPEIFTNLVRAGELGGHLPEMLSRLGALLEREDETRRRLVRATAPGAVIAGLGLAVLVAVSGLTVLGVSTALGLGIGLLLSLPPGRDLADATLLRLPLFGPVCREAAQARFARVLSALLAAGLPLLTALEASARATGNRAFANAVLVSRERLRGGHGLAESLDDSGVFSPLLLRVIAAGEETGRIEAVLERAAGDCDAEVDGAIRSLSAALGRALLVAVGAIALFVALRAGVTLPDVMHAIRR